MSYRKLDASGDMTFGNGQLDFYTANVEEVAQSIQTRLKLYQGEFFLDQAAWLPLPAIVGHDAPATLEPAMRQVISTTPTNPVINSFTRQIDPATRVATVQVDVTTIYGATQITNEI